MQNKSHFIDQDLKSSKYTKYQLQKVTVSDEGPELEEGLSDAEDDLQEDQF